MGCTGDDDEVIVPSGATSTNDISGTAGGPVVQAGTIHGGVHFGASAPPVAIPRQLPRAPAHFTGRTLESTELDRTAAEAVGHPALVVVCGTGGVGKSALALRWLHDNVDLFPDGQLYADLGAFGASGPTSPTDVLARFLRALGIPAQDVPLELAEQSSLFRSITSSRRLVVFADDAASAAQVRPLLPAAGSVVVVSSRWRLAGLALDGARLVVVEALDHEAGVSLLSRALGRDRVDNEPESARELVALCAGLPIALRVVAARLSVKPRWPLHRVVASMLDERRRLSALTVDGELPVQASFDLSYQGLSPAAARLYRLLGLYPGLAFTAGLAGAAGDVSDEEAEDLLDELVDASLLIDLGPDLYRFHDLLRLHAARHADDHEATDPHDHVLRRVVVWHLDATTAADLVVMPLRQRWGPRYDHARRRPPAFPDAVAALDWLEDRLPDTMAVLRFAAGREWDDEVWQLCEALWGFFLYRKDYGGWLAAHALGVDSAHRVGNQVAEARMHVQLGYAHLNLEDFRIAARHFTSALELARSAGHPDSEATALEHLGLAAKGTGAVQDAVDHFTGALAIAESLGHRRSAALHLRRLGETLSDAHRHAEAVAPLLRAEALAADLGDQVLRARALTSKAIALLHLGRTPAALAGASEAVDVLSTSGSDHYHAEALKVLADVHLSTGNVGTARVHLHQAAALYARSSGPQAEHVRSLLDGLDRNVANSSSERPKTTRE
ncbi:tetratricopeptide repeat protein [Umezawaea sp. Da 62-37]|uniref:tetratricopeptide repeat protein n=1 Tax=Umezawaea sp. Da 62-37 TaxID=3075927 RepID=UPI0028F6DF93|nr:tetratricopeptide repeat protein [Umezawaea sp. Da 62-37]WNV88938.1 tetratricopeptide repeat protein [Umezawaea sp. Da 62-37]